MGVSIQAKVDGVPSFDMSYSTFARFRMKIANLCNEEFGKHLERLYKNMITWEWEETNESFHKWDKETKRMIKKNGVPVELVDFCLQSDAEGKLKVKQCKVLYELLKDVDCDKKFGYAAWDDNYKLTPNKFRDIILKSAIDNKKPVEWY